ncbi:type I polyketide synthase [Xylaria castorea]|nr:type I polyketide synthase [Xylaria castorea]
MAHSNSHNNEASHPSVPYGNGTNGVHGMNGHNDTMAGGVNGAHTYTDTDQPAVRSGEPIPIAIVGMGCRFGGGVTNPSELWELCAAGKDGWTPIPEQRFNVKSLYHEDKNRIGRCHVVGGYFMEQDVAVFDAAFFNLASDVATGLDPQCRLLLETVYEAIEDAGIPIKNLAGSNTSVYTGTFNKDYHEIQTKDAECLPLSFLAGTGTAMLSNRVSHFFDLQGPSISLDTGCSAGIAAVHQGCQSIRLGESDISIIGASSTILNQDAFISASTIGAIGADGKCYAWDSRANGYGRGEGVAAIILKPLSDALRDGDHVHAVIRDTGLNQDGRTTTITSPSTDAQVKLIKECYKRAGYNISDTGYVEAHMTGTLAGDPVEAEAIARTFGASRESHDPIIVGSIKTNIGHTEPVSGLAAIIKTVFALKNAQIPPNMNYDKPNPEIPVDEWHLKVPTKLTPWPKDKLLRASVNNFGYGGTNGHAIMEPAPKLGSRSNGTSALENGGHDTDRWRVFVLSAKDSIACQNMMHRFADHLIKSPTPAADLAYTLSERRSLHPWVSAISARNVSELANRLREAVRKPSSASKRPRLGFVFNGQGAQWHAMGRELISAYPVFDKAIQEADDILKAYGASWSLKDELMRDATSTRVSETWLSQASTVAVQLCLVDLLKSWGITPSAVSSHSSGEIPAGYAAGLLSFKEALGVAYYRGEVAYKYQKISPLAGGMLAVGLGPEDAEKYIDDSNRGRIVVACVNSPSSVTLSGDLEALEDVARKFEGDGIFARKLKVPVAYHSHHMLPLAREYTDKLEAILPPEPHTEDWNRVIFSSSVTGGIVTSPKVFAPRHWVRNMTSPVLFNQALESMCFNSTDSKGPAVDMILEVGAHATLSGPIRQILKARDVVLPYAPCLRRSHDAVETMQELACELLASGYPVDLQAVNFPYGSHHATFVTDLPSYPWNHTTRFWVEPRVSKDQRFKKHAPHELLGTPLNGANDFTPTWRNFMRVGEMEWLKDHQIDGITVFPGAGYIVSAIEAVRLHTDPSEETIRGYRLRDIDIMKALVIPESAFGVETHFSLTKCSENELDHEGWYEFKLCSLTGDTWAENCKGFVSAETGDAIKVATTREKIPPSERDFLDSRVEVADVDIEALFAGMRERGTYHGPIFRNLIDSHVAGEKAITNFKISDIACEEHNYLLHPTTLDSIMQTSSPILPSDVEKDAMVLPRSIGYMHVPRDLKRRPGDKLQAFTELVESSTRGYATNIVVTGTESSGSFFEMQNFFGQAVPKQTDDTDDELEICAKSLFELDILHNVPKEIRDTMLTAIEEHEVKEQRDLLRVSYYFIQDALKELEGQDVDAWEWHFKRMFSWMQLVYSKGKRGELGHGSESWCNVSRGLKKMLADELRAGNAAGRLTVRVGENLAKIIKGDLPPFELMMEGSLLNQFYVDHEPLRRLKRIVELCAVKNPGANVLEIGAGTGSATTTMLEGFSTRGDGKGSILGQYTYTDISAGFFEAAKDKFAAWSTMMDYKKLDIEIDPFEQGFTANAYDIIVAASCLHATKNLHRTMSHVRKLLKPGGKLLLVEVTADRLAGQLIFGTLPGWWLGEEPERQMSPNAPLEMWDRVLKETGFTGVEFEVPDWVESEFHSASVILSSAVTTVKGPVSILLHNTTIPQPWLDQLSHMVQVQLGTAPSIETLEDFTPHPDKIYIAIAEVERPFVDGMDATGFENLKKLLINCYNVLWLSAGSIIDAEKPSFSATEGLLRTIRQEDSSKRCIRLDFEHNPDPWTSDKIPHIIHVLQQSFDHDIDPTDIDREYYVKGNMLHVPRTYPNKLYDIIARDLNVEPEPQLEPFHQPGKPLVWEPPKPKSGISTINPYFVFDEEIATSDILSGMVEIEAKAFGLNFREVLVQLGQLGQPLRGHEVSGTITGLGPNTEASSLKVGDKVCALVRGPIASIGRTYWTSVAKLPDNMAITWEEAASIPAAYTTSYTCLINIARLKKGETVLIHAASGATGQAAIVLAQHVGARVFATCSSESKRELLVRHFGIDPDCIFSSRDASFAPAIMAKTSGQGVDVILNSLSGPLLKASWNCIASFGRFLDITKMDMEAGRRLDTGPFNRSALYTGFDLVSLTQHNGRLTQEALVKSLAICLERRGPAVYPITSFSISDMDKAMRQMQGGTHVGKLVLVPHDGDQVPVVTHRRPISLDNPDVTYLIAGGMTGIGLATAKWMMSRGAKNLVLVSRHATTHPAARQVCEEAKLAACHVEILDCDVADERSLVKLLHECSEILPPIRGVVNAAMVLDDTVLERMQFTQWRNGIRPKIDSSRNLHKHLPDLSFFIMMSSAAGVVGHMSQSNYAAGNTFQDALARHRTAHGQPAVTIDLSAVKSVGYVADREASGDERLKARVEYVGLGAIDIEAVLRLVEDAIRNPLRSSLEDSQVIIGVNYHGVINESPIRGDKRFGTLRISSQQGLKDTVGTSDKSSAQVLAQALSKPSTTLEQATALLVDAIAAKLADIFNIPLDDIDPDLPLSRYGVDSLVAVEIRNWLGSGAKSKVSVFEILQSASLADFGALVASKSELVKGEQEGATNGGS